MPEDHEAQMQALVRKKRRRIIQNQILIQLLWYLGGFIIPMVSVYCAFIFFFGMFPFLIRWIFSLEIGGVVLYLIYDVWAIWQMRQHKREVSTEKTLKRRGEIY